MKPVIIRSSHRYGVKKLGIYVHIPFCQSKCAYCDFYSFKPRSEETMRRYVNALTEHMKSYADAVKDYHVDSVYIGGGTPTVLPPDELISLVRQVKRLFPLTPRAEFTVEANPATVSYRTLKRLRKAGVNRISFGLQSANDAELAALGRIHTREQFENTFKDARRAKFSNISVDIMFGIPNQTPDSLLATLKYVVGLSPEHISMYDLKLEEGTLLYKNRSRLVFPDEDTEADMYLAAVDYLASAGYAQYEISNFARNGKMSRHNLKYWNCEEYIGFGAAAHSFFDGTRFAFIRNAAKYVQAIEQPDSDVCITEKYETVDENERIGEYIMLRLRLRAGINERDFIRRFGRSFFAMYGTKLSRYVTGGYAVRTDNCFALTPKGLFVSNYILTDLLNFTEHGEFTFNGI